MPLSTSKPITFVTTRDRKAAEDFYENTLGLKRVPGDNFAAVYDLAGVTMRLTEIGGHVPSPHPVLGWWVDDIVSTVKALAEKGVTMAIYEGMGQDELGIWTSPDGSAKVAFFSDPDGNGLSLTQA